MQSPGVQTYAVTCVSRLSRSRWVRLLFGREFPLQDLLVVWDALFADSITLDLVDYIFVAMLLYIRDARTLHLLGKFNPITPCVVFVACHVIGNT